MRKHRPFFFVCQHNHSKKLYGKKNWTKVIFCLAKEFLAM